MKTFLFVATLLLAAPAAYAENLTVRVHETVVIDIPGATAAYAVDPSIADISVPGAGRVSITGRSAGTTQLIAVTANSSQAFLITVAPSRPTVAPSRSAAPGVPVGNYDANYSSGASQFRNSVDVFTTDGDRHTQLHVLNVHDFADRLRRSSTAFPYLFYRVSTSTREWTILDSLVDDSPLTIRSTQIRGIHLLDHTLELHAGYAASTMYEDLFLPADRRWMSSVSYGIDHGSVRWIPGLYGFFSEPSNTAARRGLIETLTVERGRGTGLFARGQVAFSGALGVAGELRYDSAVDRLRSRVSYKPDDFPTLGLGDIPGVHGEADWTRKATSRLSLDTDGSFDRFHLGGGSESTAIANFAARYALAPRLTMLAGAAASDVQTPLVSFRTIAIPTGLAWDGSTFGAAVAYRLQDTSNSSHLGDTLRFSGRVTAGDFRASLWAERQRQSPTVDLIFREDPQLDLALLRLGISVRTPEDISRVLRDNAALINLGFIEGVTVNLTPRRSQAGFDASWLSAGEGRDQLRIHTIFDRTENVTSTRDTLISTLTYSRRLAAAFDVYGSYSWWRSGTPKSQTGDSSFEIGFRHGFEGLPSFLQRRGVIQGVVFSDSEMGGVRTERSAPLAGIEVVLDGTQSVLTDRDGKYVFRGVAPGAHRVSARLPAARAAYFTTPSHAEANTGDVVDFGLIWTPARISGSVISDANLGIAGVVVSANGENGTHFSATTDSDGQFLLDVPAGRYGLEISAESIPPGYTFSGQAENTVVAVADQPQKTSFEVRALRSIAGTVAGGAGEVRVDPLGRTVIPDAAGNFVFRSLPAGTFTITSRVAGKMLTKTITLSAEPTALSGITLGESSVATATATSAPPPAPVVARALTTDEGFFVQVGAFRLPGNAVAASREVEALGYAPAIRRVGALQIVTIGPFALRSEAEKQQVRLTAARIDSVVMSNDAYEAPPTVRGHAYIVQIGAFREPSNARQLMRRLLRFGWHTFTVATDGLTLIRTGPFPSRTAALAESERLRSRGFDALVMAR